MNQPTEPVSAVEPRPPAAGEPVFPVLDTMRAIGAFGVLVTHVAFWAGSYTQHGHFGALLARADVGVALFFVLSGFLLSRPWLSAAREVRPAPAVGRYFWKRVLRIFPIYVVTVVIALSLITDNRDLGVADWLRTLLMVDIYVEPRLPSGLTQMWSLTTEVAFYLVLPLLMWLFTVGRGGRGLHPPRIILGVVLMFVVTIGWHLSWAAAIPQSEGRATLQWLPAMLNWFGLGIALALLYELDRSGSTAGRLRRTIKALAVSPGVCWSLAAGILLAAATPLAGPTMLAAPTPSESLTKTLLYGFFAALVILPGIFADPDGAYARVMSRPRLRRLGHISYGLFCLHLPILHFVMWMTGYELFQGHFWQILVLTSVLSVLAAEIAYRVVEEPFMRLRNLGRRSPSEAETMPPRASKVG